MALVLASLRDAVVRGIRFRWYRFAQPPATDFHASGMRFRLHKIESPVTFRSHTQVRKSEISNFKFEVLPKLTFQALTFD